MAAPEFTDKMQFTIAEGSQELLDQRVTSPYNESNVVKEFDEAYNEAYQVVESFYPEAQMDLDFYLGDQWTREEKHDLTMQGRAAYVFNKVQRVVKMITGYQRNNRLSSIVSPVEGSDQLTADQLTSLMLHVMQRDGYNIISDAFGGALKTGLNLIEVWMDYVDDPLDGDIRFSRIPYNALMLDPYLTKLDLSDCNYIMRRHYMSREQAKSILPEHVQLIDELPDANRDDKFLFMPQVRQTLGKDILALDEYWKVNFRGAYLIFDPITQQSVQFDGDEMQISLMLRGNPMLQVKPIQKRVVERHIISGRELITTTVNPNNLDRYPFVPFVSIFEPETDQYALKYQSVVRALRDPQRESNRRRSQMTDIIESSINSGYIAKENSVVNPRSLFESGQGKVTWVKEENLITDIQPRQAAQIPPSMFQLQELYDRDILDISGITEELLGATSDSDAGITVKLRQGAGLVTLQDLFDRLRHSQKMLSGIVMRFLQQWSPEKVQRIIASPPSQEFYNSEFGKYDAVVQEGVLTDTQRQMFFVQLLKLRELGEPIPPGLLTKVAPLQGKAELIQEIEAFQQQQSQEAQIQQQIALQDRELTNENITSITDSQYAMAQERRSRAIANLGLAKERESEAEKNEAMQALDRAKAIKELEGLDTDQLIKLAKAVKELEKDTFQPSKVKNPGD